MKIFKTHEIGPLSVRSPTEKQWVYNGLDCVVTAEVFEVLSRQLDNVTNETYRFALDLQAPVLDMRIRGVLVDLARRDEVLDEYYHRLDALESRLSTLITDGLGFDEFNWRSHKSMKALFYDVLKLPVIKKDGRPTTDRSALERLEAYRIARPLVKYVIAMRELDKRMGVLRTEIDTDGRMRTQYNIGGTNTGRLSSSFSEFGTGTNLQNIEEFLRTIFIADPGMKMAYLDAEQGESRVVGAIEHNLFGDDRYLDACEGGDLHTTVAKICWPELDWPGTPSGDRELAERPYYRDHDRRYMCKKIGHGTNYGGKPRTLASQAKVDIAAIEQFQPVYFRAFPAHLKWHAWVREQLRRYGVITSLTGRRRQFWGRRTDDATLREAIAYDPQGSLADIVNRGMLQVWRAADCQLLMQVHDAILIQYPEQLEDTIIPKVRRQLEYPIELKGGRRFLIPYGCATGWNWGKYAEGNPNGLKNYRPNDKRTRQQEAEIMDRRLYRDVSADRVAGAAS